MNYISVNSKPDHPPGDSWRFTHFQCSGVGFLPNFLWLGGVGFELEVFFSVLVQET